MASSLSLRHLLNTKVDHRHLGSNRATMSGIATRYAIPHLIFLVFCTIGVSGAAQTHSLRGSASHNTRNMLLDNNNDATNTPPPRERKGNLFVALSNDFDDDVIALYASSNDEPPPEDIASTPTASPSDPSSNVATLENGFDLAPSRPVESNATMVQTINATTTTTTTTTSAPSSSPSGLSSTAISASPSLLSTNSPSTTAIAPSPSPDNEYIVPRYHQEETIAMTEYSDEPLSLRQEDDDRTKHLVPALLTGFASTVLFCALFLVCANQRERYVQRKWQREQMRRAALTDDNSSAKSSIARAYSDPFDVFDEEEARSTKSMASDAGGSDGGGSYWVHAVMKELAEKDGTANVPSSPPNILPPLGGDEMEADDASVGLSLVSSLTQSLMTMGSGVWPGDEIALNIWPSKQRVAARGTASSDNASPTEDAELRQSGSNEETNTSVCSSLTDGTCATLKSNPNDIHDIDEATGMPAIGETEEREGVHENEDTSKHRVSIFSSTRHANKNKDLGTEDVSHSTQTEPSTILDDSLSLDLASEMQRLQTLITGIKPGDIDDSLYTADDIITKSLSEESLDFGQSVGREEI